MKTAKDPNSPGGTVNDLMKELLFALETARNHLAIAVAEGSKSMPWDLRRYCLETTEHTRRFITGLRSSGNGADISTRVCMEALEALGKITPHDGATRVCKCLRGVVAALERL